MRGLRGHRVVGALAAALLIVAACGGGGDDETSHTVALEEVEPVVDLNPCDLIDDDTASELSGADVEAAESSTDEDGTTSCQFQFASSSVAESAGSNIAASLSIGPGDEDDIPGGNLARALSIGDQSAVEEQPDKVRVVYIVREVVVRVEVVPGSGEVTDDMVDDVIEFTETTEAPVTEAVTGQPFVDDDTTTSLATTTTVDTDRPEGQDIEVDGAPVQLQVERAGGLANAVFDGRTDDVVFVRITAASPSPADSCIRVTLLDPADNFLGGGGCASPDGTSFVDRTVLPATGAYQLVLDPDGPATGSVTVQLTSATDEEGSITIDGPSATMTLSQAGALSTRTFQASAGSAVFVSIPSAAPSPADTCIRVSILDADGNFVGGGGCASPDGTSFIDRTELPTAGTYSLVLDGDGISIGSVTVQLTAAN